MHLPWPFEAWNIRRFIQINTFVYDLTGNHWIANPHTYVCDWVLETEHIVTSEIKFNRISICNFNR